MGAPRADRGDGDVVRARSPDDLQTVLVALVDCPPGPVAPRDLADRAFAATPTAGCPRAVPTCSTCSPTTSFACRRRARRLGASELARPRHRAHRRRRRPAPRVSSSAARVDGLLLALSTGGGAAGRRTLPLLLEDADWDSVAARLYDLTPSLDTTTRCGSYSRCARR